MTKLIRYINIIAIVLLFCGALYFLDKDIMARKELCEERDGVFYHSMLLGSECILEDKIYKMRYIGGEYLIVR